MYSSGPRQREAKGVSFRNVRSPFRWAMSQTFLLIPAELAFARHDAANDINELPVDSSSACLRGTAG
jgi:hypothetical protein